MGIIVLIGAIYILINCGIVECIVYLVIVATLKNKTTDKNRRGKWWEE